MLLNLQPLNVDVGDEHGDEEHDTAQATGGLGAQVATKAAPGHHEDAGNADNGEEEDDVAIDAVEEHGLVADVRGELQDHENAGGQDAGEVQDEADAIRPARLLPVAMAGEDRVDSRVAVAVEIEGGHACQGEAEERAAGDEPQDKVVASLETDGIVHLAEEPHHGVGRLLLVAHGGDHGVGSFVLRHHRWFVTTIRMSLRETESVLYSFMAKS